MPAESVSNDFGFGFSFAQPVCAPPGFTGEGPAPAASPVPGADDKFGSSVAISSAGDWIVIGAYGQARGGRLRGPSQGLNGNPRKIGTTHLSGLGSGDQGGEPAAQQFFSELNPRSPSCFFSSKTPELDG